MKHIVLAAGLLLISSIASAQLKVGTNPSQINRSSILELESTRQGLLLPRIPAGNLALSPLDAAPDGMIVYVTDSASLYIRKNSLWQRMSADSLSNARNWNVLGNAGLDSAVNFLGSTDVQPVIFRTNNAERMRITGGGNITVGTNVIPQGTDQVQVMVIDAATGMLMQRAMSAAAFSNAIVSLNGQRDSVQTFRVDSTVTTDFTISSAAGVHTFNIPTQDGSGLVSRGFLSYEDWQRFDSSARFQILHTAFSNTASATGLTLELDSIRLHAADADNPGAVSAGAQTFGGAKNFRDTLSVGLAQGTAANSTFQLNGSMSANITKVTSSYPVTETDNTILADATTGALTITLPPVGSISGRIYTIKKIAGGIDNEVIISPTGATIDGGPNYTIYNDWTFVTLQTDGSNWYVIKK